MKIILFANSFYPAALIESLLQRNMLAAIIAAAEHNPNNQRLEEFANSKGIVFKRFSARQLYSTAISSIEHIQADLFLVFTFSYKIPDSLLALPRLGAFNVHYSLLPKYRGIAPLFWQIKNGDVNGGITIHKMDSSFDTGPVVAQLPVEMIPGESQGLYASRLSYASVQLILSALETIDSQEQSHFLIPQDELQQSCYPRPAIADLTIDWSTQSAQQIVNLVNASNPACQGAFSKLRGQMIRIHEVSLANLGDQIPQTAAGTIVFSDISHGIFVQCIDAEFLRINVVEMPEGIISGSRLAALGVKAGESFETLNPENMSVQ